MAAWQDAKPYPELACAGGFNQDLLTDQTMDYKVINFQDKFAKFDERWSPKIIAQMNDYHFKLAKFKGDFTWHDHKTTDEVFIVIKGRLQIDFRDGKVILKEGEMFVVPKGVEHKPFAQEECQILLIEPAGTLKTGEAGGDQTAGDGVWI